MMANIHQSFSAFARLFFVCAILIGAFVFAMFQGGLVSWTIFYALFPFAVYSICLFFYPLASFRVKRTLQANYFQSGTDLQVTVEVNRKSFFPLLYLVLTDKWSGGNQQEGFGEKHQMFIWGWKRHVKWQYEMKNMPRGEYIASEIQIELIDFFGWIRKKKRIPVHHQMTVYPQTVQVEFIPIGAEQEGKLATSPFSFLKDTTVVTSVRDYQSGDRVSWIHWKSFARTETLMTKEFEDKRSEDLTLILDDRMSATFEDEMMFAASILKAAMKERLSSQFFQMYGEEPVLRMQSEMEFKQVLTRLAKIHPAEKKETLLSSTLSRELGQSSAVVLITASPDDSFLDHIRSVSRDSRSIICFVVIANKKAISGVLLENIKYAKSLGMTVQPVMRRQFTEAFKEVMKK